MINSIPLVSIISSMYNVEKYIPQLLNSIINQTYKNIEIILVDDGSPDKSGEIADSYSLQDKRIKVVHQKNMGFGGGRNAGMELSTGDYITFVDADDFIMPDYVEYMLSIEKNTGADIVISKNCFTTSDMTQVKHETLETYSSTHAIAEFFYPNIQLGAWNKMYRHDFIKRYNLMFVPELKTGEGLQFITNAARFANRIGVGNRKVYVYRLNNSNSATTKANVEKQGKGSLETLHYIENHLPMEEDEIKRAFKWHVWNTNRYCLRQIIDSGCKKKYIELYRDCVKEIRKGVPNVLRSNVSPRNKALALVSFLSPQISAYLQLLKRRNYLSIDKI